MYRLGLRLVLEGGREAFVRLLLTIVAVAVGVTILLSVFADFHAFQATSNRQSWESTQGSPVSGQLPQNSNAELWDYSESIYKGQFIEQLDVAALGQNAPVMPGIAKLPGPGQFYVSPALATLLQTVPKDELGDRFIGTQVGIIGEKALSFPTELAIVSGYPPKQLAKLSGTQVVTNIATAAQLQGTTNIYREAFGIGAMSILFPLLILVNTATRLSATRREERYASMRLIGATPQQINIIASVDAIVGSFLGAIVGSGIFLLVRPTVANVSFSGVKFFLDYVTPTAWGYIGLIVGIPIIAAIASLVSLHRVQISPLGVSRKTTPKKPGAWRIIPLLIGVPLLFLTSRNISEHVQNSSPLPLFTGFLLIMIGIVISGSWLTMQATKLVAHFARSAPSLLASRRLSDNPKGAFRAISGLVLAVFVGSFISVAVPAISTAENPPGQNSLSNVLRVPYSVGPGSQLSARASTALVSKLRSYPGVTVMPIYMNPSFVAFINQAQQNGSLGAQKGGPQGMAFNPPAPNILDCASVQQLSSIGTCGPGVSYVTVDASDLMSGDNPLSIYRSLPIVKSSSPSTLVNTSALQLGGVLVRVSNPNTLEQIRTYLTIYDASLPSSIGKGAGPAGADLSAWQMGEFEPETVGEVAAVRANDDENVGRAIVAVIVLTLITAGCSLAVTVGGSLVERKRPFTLLRVSGAPLGTLYKVILMEAALPLIVVSIVAAAVGLGTAIPLVKTLLTSVDAGRTALPVHPSAGYYVALGVGLLVALLLVVVTLPILKSTTKPENARFE